ncbi:response regulator [Spirosoma daeguense]
MKSKILIVEDNTNEWYLFRQILSDQYPEVEPVWKTNPTDTISYLESCLGSSQIAPQLILMNLYLPDRVEGYRLLETIKSHRRFRLIPVIVLSVSRNADDVRQAYLLRTNSYIVKPDNHNDWLQYFHLFQQYWNHTVTLPKLS